MTHSFLLAGMSISGEMKLIGPNEGGDTDRVIAFLETMGCHIERDGSVLVMSGSEHPTVPPERRLTFTGGPFPLSLVIGLLAGCRQDCFLRYGETINQDLIDSIVDNFNANGIDVFHLADDRDVVFRAGACLPLEVSLSSRLPFVKNSCLMYGLISGCTVDIREKIVSSGSFQNCLGLLRPNLAIDDVKAETRPDPADPRKKIRIRVEDYRRRINLAPGAGATEISVELPSDSPAVSAFLSLAVLLRKAITLRHVLLDEARLSFLNYLKSAGSDFEITDKSEAGGFTRATVHLAPGEMKPKRMAGTRAGELIEAVPFLAVMAAGCSGTSVFRSIDDFELTGDGCFEEIRRNLEAMGIKCGILEDGLAIEGLGQVKGADFGPFTNAGVAPAFYIAAFAGQGGSSFDGLEIIRDHYPDMMSLIKTNHQTEIFRRRSD